MKTPKAPFPEELFVRMRTPDDKPLRLYTQIMTPEFKAAVQSLIDREVGVFAADLAPAPFLSDCATRALYQPVSPSLIGRCLKQLGYHRKRSWCAGIRTMEGDEKVCVLRRWEYWKDATPDEVSAYVRKLPEILRKQTQAVWAHSLKHPRTV